MIQGRVTRFHRLTSSSAFPHPRDYGGGRRSCPDSSSSSCRACRPMLLLLLLQVLLVQVEGFGVGGGEDHGSGGRRLGKVVEERLEEGWL